MHSNEIPESRRAVRQFDSIKPIEPEVVRNCLKSARLAPTSSNLQLWEACHHRTRNVEKPHQGSFGI